MVQPGNVRQEGLKAVHDRLAERDSGSLTASELDELADALFWLDRPQESAAAWHRAHDAHLEAGEVDAAITAAWRAYFERLLVGERSIASGWLERLRGHILHTRDPAASGRVAIAESAWAAAERDLDVAAAFAVRALEAARTAGDPNLAALATEFRGRYLVASGHTGAGVRLLDEAMVAVIGGRLEPLFTGWIYCDVLSVCHDLADLRRAAEWTDAAMRWCDDLREGSVYPGLCRIHRVELSCLRGSWDRAQAEVRRACDELTAFDPRYAGQAFYLAGEIARLRGDLDDAEAAYARAHELGRSPHPGLALVWLSEGRTDAAVTALRLALDPGPSAPLPRAMLLAALVEAELRADAVGPARLAADELDALATRSESPYLDARAAASDGMVLLAGGDLPMAMARLRHAHQLLLDLGMPFEAARVQVHLGVAARRANDRAGAQLELSAARATFERLGAKTELTAITTLLGRPHARHAGLTDREIEVLKAIAKGRTDREIAARLGISEHTVARHVSNLRTKLGASSRAAATAYAAEHGLL